MALTSTLLTGLSGLDAAQTELNVVGNNIANANTTAFKASRVLFTPQFYLTDNPGSPTTSTFGGANPSQEGLGAQVAQVQVDFSEGQLQNTGINTDLAISGNGFFVVNSGSTQAYTRDGAFTLNSNNQLVDSSGNFVQGYGVDSNFNLVNGTLQNLTIPVGSDTIAQATQNATFTGTLDTGGAVATTGSILDSQAIQLAGGGAVSSSSMLTDVDNTDATPSALFTQGQTLTLSATQGGQTLTPSTLVVGGSTTVGDLMTFLQNGLAINTTPSSAVGQTPGVSLATTTGTLSQIVVNGNVGTANDLSITGGGLTDGTGATPMTFTDAGDADGQSTSTSLTVYDSLGNPVTLNVNAVLVGKSSTGTSWEYFASSPDNQGGSPVLTSGNLSFNSAGVLTGVSNSGVTINRTGTGASPALNINLNFNGVNGLTTTSSDIFGSQDGFAAGSLSTFAVGQDGIITGTFTNGLTRTVGQVALASFNNPDGLENLGGNLYQAGASSGNANITTPGNQGTGTIQAGELEQSNVNLSQEFINLIVASTGYQASSKVITTSDQLLTDLLNQQQ
jgi:flagellar hook protein FlgE